MFRQVAIPLGLVLFAVGGIRAEVVLNAGNHTLLPNTPNQTIDLHVTGDDLITQFDLVAELGDGTGPNVEPIFTGVDFTGGILDQPGAVVFPGLLAGLDQYASRAISLNGASPAVPANGFLVRLSIDTTGIDSGVFPLLLTMTDLGYNSTFLNDLNEFAPTNISNGSVTVALPPPPAPPTVETPEPLPAWQWLIVASSLGIVVLLKRRCNAEAGKFAR